MLSITELSLLLLATSPVAFGVSTQVYRNPGPGPTEPSPNYVGQSNDTIVNTPYVRGAQFDRFIQIFLENTDYATAAASPTFQKLASKGITLGEYHGITHPSQPNYVAVVGGSTQDTFFDDLSPELSFPQIPQNIETIATLLDDVGVSWASYSENMPCVGYTGFDYTSANYIDPTAAPYPYYVRRHNPFILYDSIALNATRRNRTRNFNNFAQDLQADALPQYVFITPNIVNDAHDTDINFASEWLEYWLVPLLEDKRFNSERTMVLLSFDESEIANAINKIFVLGLGNAIPQELVGTTDPTYYTHYSAISSIENNWGIPVGSLGTGDNSSTMANVFSWVANITGHKNNGLSSLTTIPVVNVTVPAAVQNVL